MNSRVQTEHSFAKAQFSLLLITISPNSKKPEKLEEKVLKKLIKKKVYERKKREDKDPKIRDFSIKHTCFFKQFSI